MKKFLTLLLSCMLLAASAAPALANQWGLSGGILEIVSSDDTYADYTAIADDGSASTDLGVQLSHAILESRYHRVLISAAARTDKIWHPEVVSTTAVYQPGDARGEVSNAPTLTQELGGFTLTYGTGNTAEEYEFLYNDHGDYYLTHVTYGTGTDNYSKSFQYDENGLMFWQSGMEDTFTPIGEATWRTDGILLSEFNITQMPRSIAEVRRLNSVSAALTEAAPDLLSCAATLPALTDGELLPVYSAPDENAFRAADGKASVSRSEACTALGTVDGWTLVQYDVSARTARIGYVQGELTDSVLTLGNIPLVAQVETFLTDDPFVSQYAHCTISAGTEMTGLAQCGEFYAYVELTQEGVTYRGFVPLKDLDKKYDTAIATGEDQLMSAVRWDVMDALIGKWTYDDSDGNTIILFAEGGYGSRANLVNDSYYAPTGNFRVYDAPDSDSSTYQLVFFTEDNQVLHYTLRLNEDASVTVTDGDTQTVYTRDEYSTTGNG